MAGRAIDPDESLRQRAEAELADKGFEWVGPVGGGVRGLIHELQVHQVELEMQNEELRRSERELEASRDRLFELYDHAPVAYLTLDEGGKVLECNLAAAQMLGVERGRLLGRRLAGFMDEAAADRFHLHCAEVFASTTRLTCELSLRRADGRVFPARVDSLVVPADETGPRRCRTVFHDLSDLREAQAGRRTEHARMSALLERLPEAVLGIDAGGKVESLNAAAEQTFGSTEAELRGRTVATLFATAQRDAAIAYLRERLTSTASVLATPPHETFGLRPGGAEFPLELEVAAWDDRGERKLILVARDLTERKRAERELRQAQRMEAVGTLAAGIAHDFGNLLQGILGCLQVALHPSTTHARAQQFLRRAASAAERGGGLVDQLLGFSRRQDAGVVDVRVDALVADTSVLLGRLLGEHIRLEIQPGAPRTVVWADPMHIEQILMNLTANARDAMPAGGTFTLRTEEVDVDEANARRHGLAAPGPCVRLVATDTGTGMDDETRRRMFEPFYTTKAKQRGTGLGLSTVMTIVSKLGGSIEVESELGRGTRFSLLLPGRRVEPTAAEREELAEGSLTGTVLVVEDEPLVRTALTTYLAGLGLEVLETDCGTNALELVVGREGPIDVLVTDVMMPGMLGPELAQRLGKRWPELEVLFVSGIAREDLERDGTLVPGVPLLRKPFSRAALVGKVRELLAARVRS